MRSLLKSLKDNLFILSIGIIYCFSFSKMSVGDCFFRSLENNYPLFYLNNYGTYPAWLGFEPAHLLGIPTLRAIQLFMANFGFLPNALLLVQLVNLLLALCTLKLIYSLLLRMNTGKAIATATTIFFAFSFGFYANMNGELHHFSIFLFAAVIWLLWDIETRLETKSTSVFIASLCLTLLPLYHLETIVFSGLIILYILLRKNLRAKFAARPYQVTLGLFVIPLILIISSIVFHYFEVGRPNLNSYTTNNLLPCWRINATHNVFVKACISIKAFSVYIMSRAHLESFSIISRTAKILQHYKDVVFYSNGLSVNTGIAITVAYLILFISVNITGVILAIKNRNRITGFIWLLIAMLIVYLFSYGLLISSVFLLSEFFIITVMVQCIILGYFFGFGRKWHKLIFCFLVIMTLFSNIALFIYPQKVSAESIARILDEIKPKHSYDPETAAFRISLFDFPYGAIQGQRIKVYFDEHVYDSKIKTLEQISLIDSEFKQGKKVFLISPGFLFGEDKEINIKSVLPMGINKSPFLEENLEYLLQTLRNNYQIEITKKYVYNFATLGQLGKLAVVELKNRRR